MMNGLPNIDAPLKMHTNSLYKNPSPSTMQNMT